MKSLFAALFILIALIGVCYYWSEKTESKNVAERTSSTDSTDSSSLADSTVAPVSTPETEHATGEYIRLPDPPQETEEPKKKEIASEPAKDETPVITEPTELIPKPVNPVKPTKSVPKASDYYAAVANLKDTELKEGLHKIIRGHRVLSYGDLWGALRDLDGGDDAKVVLIYDRSQRSSSKNGGDQGDWNREHLWPRAYGVRRSSAANTDLHHIRASDVRINGKRGHLYFDETEGKDFSGKRYSSDLDSWEPPNEVKGDIARAMFYMTVRYEGNKEDNGEDPIDLELSNRPDSTKGVHGKLSILLRWHKADPVSDEERTRNDKVHRSYQGNRNPFIDHPEWVKRLYN